MSRMNTDAMASDPRRLTRGQRLWERMIEYRRTARLSLWRARLAAESYRETEGQAPALRRARAFEKIGTRIPIFIEEDDLLAGAFAARPTRKGTAI